MVHPPGPQVDHVDGRDLVRESNLSAWPLCSRHKMPQSNGRSVYSQDSTKQQNQQKLSRYCQSSSINRGLLSNRIFVNVSNCFQLCVCEKIKKIWSGQVPFIVGRMDCLLISGGDWTLLLPPCILILIHIPPLAGSHWVTTFCPKVPVRFSNLSILTIEEWEEEEDGRRVFVACFHNQRLIIDDQRQPNPSPALAPALPMVCI